MTIDTVLVFIGVTAMCVTIAAAIAWGDGQTHDL